MDLRDMSSMVVVGLEGWGSVGRVTVKSWGWKQSRCCLATREPQGTDTGADRFCKLVGASGTRWCWEVPDTSAITTTIKDRGCGP